MEITQFKKSSPHSLLCVAAVQVEVSKQGMCCLSSETPVKDSCCLGTNAVHQMYISVWNSWCLLTPARGCVNSGSQQSQICPRLMWKDSCKPSEVAGVSCMSECWAKGAEPQVLLLNQKEDWPMVLGRLCPGHWHDAGQGI